MNTATKLAAPAAPLPYAQAKAQHVVATQMMDAAGAAEELASSEYNRLVPGRPERTIEFDHPGFTMKGITLAPHKSRQELTPCYVENPERAELFADHPEYLAYREEVRAWEVVKANAAKTTGIKTVERAWEDAVDAQDEARVALLASVPGTMSELIEKLDYCRSLDFFQDGATSDEIALFLDAMSRDFTALVVDLPAGGDLRLVTVGA